MGSLTPSVRVRNVPAPASSLPLSNGVINNNGGHHASNGYMDHLHEELAVFESDVFDAQAYVEAKCQSMSEKGIRKLCEDLLDLKRSSAEEMRKSVYANYAAFIRTSREISDLEGELLAMRNLLSSQAALVHTLAESGASKPVGSMKGDNAKRDLPGNEKVLSELERQAEALPDILDVLLAEKKVEQALLTLDEGDRLVAEGLSDNGKAMSSSAAMQLQDALLDRRVRLAEYLAEATQQPSVRGTELRSAIAALDRLGDGARAHTLLLNSHHERLQHNIRGLRPSGTSYGGAYTAALSQLVFSAIAQATRDSEAVFGEEPAYASELLLWAHSETEMFASLVKRHVLSASAAAGGLRAAAECVQIALGHCLLLEDQGLALCPVLSKLVRPSVEQALEANLTRIEESVAALAAADDWVLTHPPAMLRGSYGLRSSYGAGSGGLASVLKLSSSAHRFNFMVQDFLEDVAPLISMQLGAPTLDGLSMLFDQYIDMLIKAVPSPGDDEDGGAENGDDKKVRIAVTEAQQLALLGNASALADELLPRAAAKLVPGGVHLMVGRDDIRSGIRRGNTDRSQFATVATRLPELKDWRRRLQRGVDRLRDHFCRQCVLELIYYSDDAESQLSPEMYLNLDYDGADVAAWQQEPMPSAIFQALFNKLTSIQQTAKEVLTGRERVVAVLLMRLTETLVIWLSEDNDFWDALEEGESSLGSIGLQQFVLDMQFVIQVAVNGRFLSRHMSQVVADISLRAVNTFAATGADPNSVLLDDEWFLTSAQDALRKLLDGWNRQVSSPTASISAQSVSSFRSHGSE